MPRFERRLAVRRLPLRHTFRISRSSREAVHNVFMALSDGQVTGYGEAAPSARYGEDPGAVLDWMDALPLEALGEAGSPGELREILDRHNSGRPVYAARVMAEMAWLDWHARSEGRSLGRTWSPDHARTPPTSYTIGMGSPEEIRRKVREAENAGAPLLKVKLGDAHDEETIRTVRSLTDRPLRVDANEGWGDLDLAHRRIAFLEGQGVEMVEQPMPAGMEEAMRELKAWSPIPLCADESFRGSESLEELAGSFDVVNIKLMKIGSLLAARQSLHRAHDLGLKVMIGCMVESSLAIAAGAAVALEADYADLDGFLLVEGDPFEGLHLNEDYRIGVGEEAGLGVSPSREAEVWR
ncbi:MAG: dipeptide epimerase [Balneolaceae bacterium]|nr:dipeptide epimerase [Balneolaceae bacterium]